MKLILIAALNTNRVIGKDGTIPWHIPEDLERFKQRTLHHTIVMGRKTFESIGKPLPERKNIVISRGKKISNDVEQFSSMKAMLQHCSREEKIFIIGGGEVFRETLALADELVLTIVENNEGGDTFFPPFQHLVGKKFTLISTEQKKGYRFETYITSADTPVPR